MAALQKLTVAARIRIRLSHLYDEIGARTLGRIAAKRYSPAVMWMRHLPQLPWRHESFPPAWPTFDKPTPPELQTVPGIWHDPEEQERAYAEEPLHNIQTLYPEVLPFLFRWGWGFYVPSFPRTMRVAARQDAVIENQPPGPRPSVDVQVLTDEVRREAARIGLTAVGFAPYDPKYTYEEAPLHDTRSVIVCVLEQSWEMTQRAPHMKTERHVWRVYAELGLRTAELAEFLQKKGFGAQPNPPNAHSIVIHYGQQAGLGQMGLNGQLLTPQVGSRCRITLITTDAPLAYGAPVDYGVHAICDACQICVRRCPPGAIPKERKYHRGVKKAKIKIDRCWPTVAQAHGCAVCIKVCPVQRYGLDRVRTHFVETGAILGKGTDELEGYTWPLDGRFYGSNAKPRITPQFINPGSFFLDPKRQVPPAKAASPHVDV